MSAVLLDTSALYASLAHDDPNHHRARQFFEEFASVTFVVADTIFSEAMTLVKLRLGAVLATRAGAAMRSGEPFRIHQLLPEEVEETWRIFSKYTDKSWSYADCSVLALAHARKVGHVFAFDRHYDQMSSLGLLRIP
jgi:predicted nucleic acid-binding protein